MAEFMRVEDLQVYQKLCQLHLEICQRVKAWPSDERFELTSQIRRSSNSAPANLAEKHSDRHVKNKIEGVRAEKAEIENRLQTVYFDLRDLEEQKKGVEDAINGVRQRVKGTRDNILKIKRTLSNVLTAFANTQNKARLQFGRIKSIEQ